MTTVEFSTLSQFGEKAIPTLLPFLRDPSQSAGVREGIAYSLGFMLNDTSVEALHELLRDPERRLRMTALKSLAGDPRALPWILEATEDKEVGVIATALETLSKYRGDEVVATLVKALSHRELSLRQTAADVLSKMEEICPPSAIPALLEGLRDNDSYLRFRSRDTLTKMKDASLIPTLFEMFKEIPYKGSITEILRPLKSEQVTNGLLECLKSEDLAVRTAAASALGAIGDHGALPALLQALNDEEEEVRKFAALALRDLKDARAVPDLIALSRREDEFDEVVRAAALALEEIGTREARLAYREWNRKQEKS